MALFRRIKIRVRVKSRSSLGSICCYFSSTEAPKAPPPDIHFMPHVLSWVRGIRANCWVTTVRSQRDFAESKREAGAVLGPRERGAAPAPQLDRPTGWAPHPQQEVEVSWGVHGVKDVGVVWDHQLCWTNRGQRSGIRGSNYYDELLKRLLNLDPFTVYERCNLSNKASHSFKKGPLIDHPRVLMNLRGSRRRKK